MFLKEKKQNKTTSLYSGGHERAASQNLMYSSIVSDMKKWLM